MIQKWMNARTNKICPVCKFHKMYAGQICPSCQRYYAVDANGKIRRKSQGGTGVQSLAEAEKIAVINALRFSHGNREQAAKALGIARSTLFVLLKRYDIKG